ncbi:MAG TPA: RNA polymerase sigma factor [Planctomycetota bacterium]
MAPGSVHLPTDETAFATFLHATQGRVLALLRRLCASEADADDVLQETLAKAWRLRAAFDARRNGEAWLLQAAFRCFCDHRERRRKQPPTIAGDDAEAPVSACALELRDEVRHRLAALAPIERDLLLGFHVHDLSLRDLAARYGLPLNTVKSHLHRARTRLQREHHERD